MKFSEKSITIEFCLPVFNEEKILKKNVLMLLDFCKKGKNLFDWKIVIINNGSTDSSADICCSLKNPQCIIENISEGGKGRALRTYWSKSQADILVYMDIDLAVSLENIHDLLKPLYQYEADLVIGSRLLPTSTISRSLIREASSRGYSLLSRLILKHPYRDLQCGFKAIRRTVFNDIFPMLRENRWFFDTELIIFAHYKKFRVKEIPVDWSENRYDLRKSKVRVVRDAFFFLKNLITLKFRLKQDLK